MQSQQQSYPGGATDEPLLEGTPYRVEGRMGSGGMGHLFAATDRISGERVVLKVLRPELARQRDAHERMRVEGEAVGLLAHPNIVAGRGFGVTVDGRPYVAMERLQGRTLRAEVRTRGALPLPEAIRHTRQLLSALRAVHAAGVVHRDVKPDNVMLCEVAPRAEPRIKLIDFGIAKVIAKPTTPPVRAREIRCGFSIAPLAVPTLDGICVGTPRYVSPEQASGAEIDPRSDVYAAGILLYTLVAGCGPFDEIRDVAELLRAHRDLAPPPPSRLAKVPIPARLEEVILRAISKNPGDRFGSALAFSHELWRTLSRLSASPAPGLAPARRQTPAPSPVVSSPGPVTQPPGDAPAPAPPVSRRDLPRIIVAAASSGPRASQLRRRRCRRTRWMCDAGLVLGAAAFGAAAGVFSMWLIP